MKTIQFYFLPILLVLFSSCYNNHRNERSLYVSSAKHLSTQEPFHEILIQKQDSLYKYDFWENSLTHAEVILEDLNDGEEIRYSDNKLFKKNYNYTSYEDFYMYHDTTHFYTFVKTAFSNPIEKNAFLKNTQNKTFKTKVSNNKTPNSSLEIIESLEFSKDSLTYYWDYVYGDKVVYKETETVKVNYFEVEDQLFIIPSIQEKPYPLYQVFNYNQNEIELRNFIDFETKSNTYSLNVNLEQSNYSNYSLCKNDFQKIYYVSDDVRYSKGMEHLLGVLQKNAPKADHDGFINIHYTINCNGDVGRLGLELLDTDYKPASFNPELIKHIVERVTQIKSWDNYQHKPYYGSLDTKAFFLIKIKNQKIVDVCP